MTNNVLYDFFYYSFFIFIFILYFFYHTFKPFGAPYFLYSLVITPSSRLAHFVFYYRFVATGIVCFKFILSVVGKTFISIKIAKA